LWLSFNLPLKGNKDFHLDKKPGKVYIQIHYSVALSAFVSHASKSGQISCRHKAGVVAYALPETVNGLLLIDL
jgi:hypothetical protein